jgi:integrase
MKDTKQKGQLVNRGEYGYYGRYYIDEDGRRRRVCVALKANGEPIFDKARARYALARLIAANAHGKEAAEQGETFEQAARRVVDDQKRGGTATWSERLSRLEKYVFPKIGAMTPKHIKASTVLALLKDVRDLGRSQQTMTHVKVDISIVLGDLLQNDDIERNVCSKLDVPEALPAASERTKKEREVLSDEELSLYLSWRHPDPRHQIATLERQVMACVARMFGGLRTSDLHAIRWENFELQSFAWGYAPRRKGKRLSKGGKPQKLVVPTLLRPILRSWWMTQGAPPEGLVFPVLKGDNAGKGQRKRSSHAEGFRTDLRRALGIEQLVWKEGKRTNGRPYRWQVWEDVRPLTPRERALLEECDYTKPVDFHSWRRSFAQGLADAGVNAQQAQALAGHASMAAHEAYLSNSKKLREIPEAALPHISGHNLLGTIHELPRVTTNTTPENEQETPPKLAVGFPVVNFESEGRRFESYGVRQVKRAPIAQQRVRGDFCLDWRDGAREPAPLVRHSLLGGRVGRAAAVRGATTGLEVGWLGSR